MLQKASPTLFSRLIGISVSQMWPLGVLIFVVNVLLSVMEFLFVFNRN